MINNDWYSITTSKLVITDDYNPMTNADAEGVHALCATVSSSPFDNKSPVMTQYNKSPIPSVDLYDKMSQMEEKIIQVLNENRENNEFIQTRLDMIENKLREENLRLKTDIVQKNNELQRLKNSLIRHKIPFHFVSDHVKIL